jgi:hypothetical protein
MLHPGDAGDGRHELAPVVALRAQHAPPLAREAVEAPV